MKPFYTIILALMLSGCAMFQEEITQSAEKIQEGVDYYCLTSEPNRERLRGAVNPTPGGATIVVTCPGDS